MTDSDAPRIRPAIAWLPVATIAALHFAAHLATAGRYGIFRDEYYYLACADRLALGYVDQPPLSIFLLASVTAVFGDGVWALRLVPALCGAALVVLAAWTAAALGGGRFAQLLAALAMAIAGVVQVLTGFYSMNAIDLVVYAGAWAILARWIDDPRPRLWLALGLLLGLGLLNKIGLLVFGLALVLALLVSAKRRVLLTPWPWLGGALALLLFSPHLAWQAANGWPTLEFIANAQQYKIAGMSPPAFFGELALEQHPANLLVWAPGLAWLLFFGGKRFRLLGVICVLALAILLLQRAKPYYAAGLFPVLFAAGGCAWESLARRPRLGWVRPVMIAFLIANGIFFLPLGIPVLPVEQFARWQEATGIAPAAQEVGHTSALPQFYSDRFGWEELAREVAAAAATLPPAERREVVVIAENYGHAGALEHWAERYDLPPVFSGHNSYYSWLPEELPIEVAILVGRDEEQVRAIYREVHRAGTMTHPWALESGLPIWIARRPRIGWEEMRERLRFFI